MGIKELSMKFVTQWAVKRFAFDEQRLRGADDETAMPDLLAGVKVLLSPLVSNKPNNADKTNQMWDSQIAEPMGRTMGHILQDGAVEGRMARNLAVLDHAIMTAQSSNFTKTHGVLSAVAGMVMPAVMHPDTVKQSPEAQMYYMMLLQRTAAVNDFAPMPAASRIALRDQLNASAAYCDENKLWPNLSVRYQTEQVVEVLGRSRILPKRDPNP